MRAIHLLSWLASAVQLLAQPHNKKGGFHVRPFNIDLGDRVPRMLDLVKNTRLPAHEDPAAKDSYNITLSTGISLSTLKQLQTQWSTSFDWEKEQATMNRLNHFTVEIEGQTVHFIHTKTNDPDSVPILLLHGWPGSFLEMVPLIDELNKRRKKTGGKQRFNIVIPSLPGFGFSSAPPADWTVDDSARILNTLMDKVLGYPHYAVHATDYGASVAYSAYDQFNQTVRAAHLVFLPFRGLTSEEIKDQGIALSAGEEFAQQRLLDWQSAGNAYSLQHATKPNTIGLSLYDNPIGQLSWIAEKFISWSDPRQGTGSSLVTHHEILRQVSLYYLTQTFVSSVYMYNQNPNGFYPVYTKARTDAPLLFTNFKYNVGFWPEEVVKQVGNLVSYTFQDFGGHFPALDSPSVLAADIRKIHKYWKD
ncbi:EHN domain-containing protein [Fusarium falciforme]|uniref:EHN domain-containing protein n=1 Tax=Fusarium falciforme TaxID=195108 RepID=UPI0023004327|nr:EHN domain-containing protein [Fusarium falciforme]WAO88679.1 EHN domain-containing protein [Fusarium falciforme]